MQNPLLLFFWGKIKGSKDQTKQKTKGNSKPFGKPTPTISSKRTKFTASGSLIQRECLKSKPSPRLARRSAALFPSRNTCEALTFQSLFHQHEIACNKVPPPWPLIKLGSLRRSLATDCKFVSTIMCLKPKLHVNFSLSHIPQSSASRTLQDLKCLAKSPFLNPLLYFYMECLNLI